MAERMLKFVGLEQRTPDKRAAAERRADFGEIYRPFTPETARAQASRCSQCGVPFCSIHCPLSNNIPDWLKLTAEGRMEEAYELASATNTFPEICGRICPQDRLCEGNCVIERDFNSVTIGAVEKHIVETAFANNWVKAPHPRAENGISVGIVGAGPGGLAAAEWLRRKGYTVHVYDRHDRIGGLMMYGIPGFKLEKHVVQRRWDLLREAGITFHLNTEIGRDLSFADLRARHASVLIATGVYKARDLQAPGSGLKGIIAALDYLIDSNRRDLGDALPATATPDAKGKHVVVIGGGDTAMDCVRTAIRQGAASVSCLYRRDRANMPGSMREVANAEEEGVNFVWLSAPEAFLGDVQVSGVRAVRMRLGQPDGSGRQGIEEIENSSFTLQADLVVKALGFDPEDIPGQFAEPTLEVSRWGTLKIDRRNFMTSLPGVFAAGDIVRGASLVVWAIRDGRDAAAQMHAYMQTQKAAEAVAAE